MILNIYDGNFSVGEYIHLIAKAFKKEGAVLNSRLRNGIFDFLVMQTEHDKLRQRSTLRKETRGHYKRIKLIKKLFETLSNDFNDNIEQQLKDNILMAIFENAIIKSDSLNAADTRSNLGLSFHLWNFKKILEAQKIVKPTEVLVEILNSIFDKKISAGTVHNRCSLVQGLIDESIRLGACHKIQRIGIWPKADSNEFIREIVGNCDNCNEIWSKILVTDSANTNQTFKDSANELKKRIPDASFLIDETIYEFMNEMPLKEIIQKIPRKFSTLTKFLR